MPGVSAGNQSVANTSSFNPVQRKRSVFQELCWENICRDEPADPSLLIPCPFCPPAELLSAFLPPSFMFTYLCDSSISV